MALALDHVDFHGLGNSPRQLDELLVAEVMCCAITVAEPVRLLEWNQASRPDDALLKSKDIFAELDLTLAMSADSPLAALIGFVVHQ